MKLETRETISIMHVFENCECSVSPLPQPLLVPKTHLLDHKDAPDGLGSLLDPKDAPDGLGSLRAWSLIRRASSPPSPAVREKGKNSRATHVEKLISPLLMLGEGLGERVDRAFTVLENVRNRNSFSSLEFHNPRVLQGIA